MFNIEHFVVGHDTKIPANSSSDKTANKESGLISTLSNLPNSYINPVTGSIPVFETFKILPGITGLVMCLILSLIVSSSTKFLRLAVFNVFWYMHQVLAVLFFVLFAGKKCQIVISL